MVFMKGAIQMTELINLILASSQGISLVMAICLVRLLEKKK